MSKYTTEIRFICEHYAGLTESVGYSSVNTVIKNSRTKVFDFEYPIYDESYRSVLETKILKHFYGREIGAETVGLWKLWLDTRMNEIMPYYNQLYKSAMLEFNPLYDVDVTTKRDIETDGKTNNKTNKTDSGNNKTNTNTNGDSWNYYSDTPQGGINGIADMTYLTTANHDTVDNESDTTHNYTDNSNTTSNGEYANTEEYIEHIYGKRSGVSYSKMLEEYRKTILNIDMMIIESLNDLFLNLW